jgi:hypothetical protein
MVVESQHESMFATQRNLKREVVDVVIFVDNVHQINFAQTNKITATGFKKQNEKEFTLRNS